MGMTASVRPRLAVLAGLAGLVLLAAAPARALEIQGLTSPGGAVFWLVEGPKCSSSASTFRQVAMRSWLSSISAPARRETG